MPDGPFKPGDQAPVAGIYKATHYQHRMPHEVFAAEGDAFPDCRRCGGRVRFTLLQPANHIERDQDFTKAAKRGKAKKARVGKSPR